MAVICAIESAVGVRRRSDETRPSPARAFQKRIDDRAIAEPPAGLKIIAVERFAARLDRGGEDQRVVEGDVVTAGEFQRGRCRASVTGMGSSSAALHRELASSRSNR